MPETKFIDIFGPGPVSLVRAPGRVNLIGDHTDYNGGYVFPAAVDCEIRVAFRRSDDTRVELVSLDFNEKAAFDLADVSFKDQPQWAKYPMGVASILQNEGHSLKGLRAVIKGNIPVGAGLSSSAAIEVASAMAFSDVSGLKINRGKLALICQRAENEFVGMKCGIMDQYACLLGRKGHALFLDCVTLEHETVPLNESQAHIVVCDTKVQRRLVGSPYNQRREECREAFKLLHRRVPEIKSYKDITLPMFKAYAADLPETIRKRARHVVTENARVVDAVRSLKEGNLIRFGALMDASHESLRNDFEVSCNELDALVGFAKTFEGVFGSRMTGAGFGGCMVAFVRPDRVDSFMKEISADYRRKTGVTPGVHLFHSSEGATLIDADGQARVESHKT